ncbi:unannotated protein [freshwater metagenome]|uniref:Unannotated protein n=1 Tax=freshwater metagenome TaxID=449393 RepID=A0A6J7HZ86_9ZZZZ|nr:hypothetical protein [Actinomycetota bacterium]
MTSTTTPTTSTTRRTRPRRIGRSVVVGLALVGAVGAGTTSASARSGDDDRVIRTGACTAGADWKLKVKTDDGRLEVEGEIDSNVAGQRWRWTLRHNGSITERGTGTTGGRSGSFEVERTIVDLAGTDTVTFRATRDGQVCRGVVNY